MLMARWTKAATCLITCRKGTGYVQMSDLPDDEDEVSWGFRCCGVVVVLWLTVGSCGGYVFFRGFFFRFPGEFFSEIYSQATQGTGKQASKQASQQASKQASEQASKPASKQASQPASKQARQQASQPASKPASQ